MSGSAGYLPNWGLNKFIHINSMATFKS